MTAEKQVVFILGAGASLHAGIPVLQNFLLRTFAILEGEKLCPGTTGLGGYPSDFNDFQNVLDQWMRWSRKTWDVEKFFQCVDDNQSNEEMKRIRGELIWTMFRTMQICEERFRDRKITEWGYDYRPVKIYEEFAAQIKNMLSDSCQVQILTLNYDTCLDQALMRRNIRPEYHLKNPKKRNDPIGKIPINFLKIHGSVNWRAWIDRHTNEVEVHWDSGPGSWHTSPEERDVKEYLLVPPSHKGRRDTLLEPLMTKAAEAVRKAHKLVFLGIGFPPTDAELACEFSKWASEGPRKDLHIWNPDCKVINTYERFFTKNVNFHPHLGKPQGILEYVVLEEQYRELL